MSYVYIIQMGRYFKVGVSNNPEIRLKAIDGTLLPEDPKLIFNLKKNNAYRTESKIHREYKKYNVRGEWFLFNQNLLKKISKDYNFVKVSDIDNSNIEDKIIKNLHIKLKEEVLNLESKTIKYSKISKDLNLKLSMYSKIVLTEFKKELEYLNNKDNEVNMTLF